MAKAKQLTVCLENVPGTLAQLAKVLGDAKVNILALLIPTSGVEGSAQLVVNQVEKAKRALDRADLPYTVSEVLCLELPNVPGALGRFAAKLAAKKININSAYQTAAKRAKKACVVLGVSDLGRAARVR